MRNPLLKICILLLLVSASSIAQNKRPITACNQATFNAFKPLPKLEYECPDDPNDSDDKILKLPERLTAIRAVVNKFEGFTNAAWWQANVDDLNACKVHGSVGEFTVDEKEKWKSGDYASDLFGNHQVRLALITDRAKCFGEPYAKTQISSPLMQRTLLLVKINSDLHNVKAWEDVNQERRS